MPASAAYALLFATLAAARETGGAPPIDSVRLPIVYLHLNKCGGTTVCQLFQNVSAHLRFAKAPPSSNINCNCDMSGFASALRGGDGAALAEFMHVRKLDVCAIERLHWWPTAANFTRLRRTFPGTLLTTLREPFAHFVSSFERDSTIEKLKKPATPHELERALARYAVDARARSHAPYGVSYPNFAVRGLNGLASSSTGSRAEPAPERFLDGLALEDGHLRTARDVLGAFDRVFVLELGELSAFFGHAGATQISNNQASSHFKRGAAHRHADGHADGGRRRRASMSIEPSAGFIAEWRRANRLDVELYSWASQMHNRTLARAG